MNRDYSELPSKSQVGVAVDRGLFVLRCGRMLSGVVLNCDSSDLDDFRDCFIVIVSSLAEPGRGIVPGPGD